jgi:LuxR family maltose regulon positive regulatory protein
MSKLERRRVYWDEHRRRYQIEMRSTRMIHWPGIALDSAEWFSWLKQVPSFAFHARAGGHFTARKETRARGGVYWIAYRHSSGQLVKKYIGTLAQVSTARLEEIAGELEVKASPGS